MNNNNESIRIHKILHKILDEVYLKGNKIVSDVHANLIDKDRQSFVAHKCANNQISKHYTII